MLETITPRRFISRATVRTWTLVAGIPATSALYVLAWAYPTFPGDEAALVRFQALRTSWLDGIAIGFANLGALWVFLPAVAVLIVFLFLTRRYADIGLVFGGFMVVGLGYGLKLLVDRPRPGYQIIEPFSSGLSFPSGHTLLAVIMGGLLVYLVSRCMRPGLPRRAIQCGIFSVVAGMGASRVYLGVHWPSDVIGSYVLGVLALIGLVWLRNNFSTAS
jgi:undecaprenyl-diphosphatase